MNTDQKRYFIDELLNNVRLSLLEKVDSMPADWDGIELRQYIAIKFSECVISGTMAPARKRRFNSEVLERNL